jgi:hypothetical protein
MFTAGTAVADFLQLLVPRLRGYGGSNREQQFFLTARNLHGKFFSSIGKTKVL